MPSTPIFDDRRIQILRPDGGTAIIGNAAEISQELDRLRAAEETLTELQAWLKRVRDMRLGWADELRATSNYNSAELWTREAKMAQEILDWLETKRSGNA